MLWFLSCCGTVCSYSKKVTAILLFAGFACQSFAQSFDPNDVDGDGIPNTADIDADNDGILNAQECGAPIFNHMVLEETFEVASFTSDARVNDAACDIPNCNLEPQGGGLNIGDPVNGLNCWSPVTGTTDATKALHTLPTGNAVIYNSFADSPALDNPFSCQDVADTNNNGRVGEIVSINNIQIVEGEAYSVAVYFAEITGTDPFNNTYSFQFFDAGTSTLAGIADFPITNLEQGDIIWQLNEMEFTATTTKKIDIALIQTSNVNGGAGDIAIDSFSILGSTCTQDTDEDGILDILDSDSDNDGVPDNIEAQAADNYIAPTGNDTDGDGVDNAYDINDGGVIITPINTDITSSPDYLNTDSDSDTIPDAIEVGQNSSAPADSDQDGIPNYRDTDSDGDGLLDVLEAGGSGSAPRDSDDDGTPDFIDIDSDNDQLLDSIEAGMGSAVDTDNDGIEDYRDKDTDNDGIADILEIASVLAKDADNDGIADRFDADADADGQIDMGKSDDDGDGIDDAVDADLNGNLRPDLDANGIIDIANLIDSDGDNIPNIRDLDSDNDGLSDVREANTANLDADDDGRIDGVDTNANGVIDSVDEALSNQPIALIDTDGDNLPDTLDLDSDGDGLTDLSESGLAALDPDSDGRIGSGSVSDNNSNGLPDLVEPSLGGEKADFIDRDFDGVADNRSLDSDGDGISDLIEATGPQRAASLDPDGDGKVGSAGSAITDNNSNGLADNVEGTQNSVDANARLDTNNDGVPDVAQLYLLTILVQPPAQPVDPVSGIVPADLADFDRDGYPDVIEVLNGGDPLSSAQTDSDGDGIPDWVENTDVDGDGSNDNDNDGFNDLLEQMIGTDLSVANTQAELWDAANAVLLNQNRYEGRSIKPVIWVDITQAGDEVINIAADGGPVTLIGRIGNYRLFGDPRDASTVPVYRWSSDLASLSDAITGDRDTANLTVNPAMLTPGFYTVELSVTLAEHESITEQIIEVVQSDALRDSDGDRHPNTSDDLSADVGYLRSIQTQPERYLTADSPVIVDGQLFTDKAIRLRAGQLAQANRATGISLSQNELTTVVEALIQRGYNAASPVDTDYRYTSIYDYEVINLPFVGASARIVIPLDNPVPQGGVLRKYTLNNGWQDFVENAQNTQFTAPWFNEEEGLCPDPTSDTYSPGLTAGDNCLLLTIVDGGLNDGENDDANNEDGQGDVNGLIKDPIAIGELISAAPPEGKIETGLRGGGASSWLALMMLFMLCLAWRLSATYTLRLSCRDKSMG